MKRLIALVIALLLPCGALAEAWRAGVELEVDEAYYAELLAPKLAALTGDQSVGETLAKASGGLLNGLSLTVVAQEDAAQLDLQPGGKEFIDLAIHVKEDCAVITSDLMRGYGLLGRMNETAAPAPDLQQLSAGMLTAAAQSLSGMEHVSAQGVFAGDAYTGGTFCDTYTLDDRDVAAILSSLLTPEARAYLTELMDRSGLAAEEILGQWDAQHAAVAEANAHTYIVRLVRDAQNRLIGLSLTVLRGDAQVATLSCGFAPDGLRIVLGTGSAEQNDWWYDFIVQAESETGWQGVCTQLTGAKDESFSYASAVTTDPRSLIMWQMNVTRTETGSTWRYEHEANGSDYDRPESVVSVLECSDSGAFESVTTLLLADREMAQLHISATPCEAIAPLADGLTLCDLDSGDESQLVLQQEITDMIAQVLMARIMLLIPGDAMMLLLQ